MIDQIKVGQFIAAQRKSQGYTQAALAEKLGITDRAVSKWETGKSMPDTSIMLELCGLLGISVNELLSGELLEMDEYKKMAEENLIQTFPHGEADHAHTVDQRMRDVEWDHLLTDKVYPAPAWVQIIQPQ